jgi:hypothetical protein
MKAEILKIAGVKSEKEFYKLFPDEESFMAKHGKALKKVKLSNAIPNAQYGCKGKSCTKTGDGIKKVGVRNQPSDRGVGDGTYIAPSNEPLTWNELQNYNSDDLEGKELKQYNKGIKTRTADLQGQFPGLTQEQVLAAGADSNRVNRVMFNVLTGKSDVPQWDQQVTPYDRAWFNFYRPLMNQSTRITVPQIIQYQSKQPGGLPAYKQTVEGNYGRKKAKDGSQIRKLQQLTDFGNPPQYYGGGPILPGTLSTAIENYQLENFDPQLQTSGQLKAQSKLPGISQAGLMDSSQIQLANKTVADNKNALDQFAGTKQAGLVGKVYKGIRALKAEKERLKQAEKWNKVSGVVAQAASLIPDEQKRRYVEPSDIIMQPQDFANPQGGQQNPFLQAANGMQIGGNLTEIQNTYSPTNTLYDNLGYEPLNDSSKVKAYKKGGKLKKAADGIDWTKMLTKAAGMEGMDKMGAQLGGSAGSWIGGGGFEENAGSQLGSDLGGGVGEALGKATGIPGVDKLLKTLGGFQFGLIGGFLDKKPKKTRELNKQTMRNIQTAGLQSGIRGLQGGYSQYVEDGGTIPQHEEGGWVSHDWQPQVITQFGGHNMKDLLKADPMMKTLRTGGRITQNNMYPQDQYALGGSLKTTWGGYAEPISKNPYDESETVMFRGKSHDESDGNGHTGIGVKYGDGQHDSYTDYAEYGTEQADADVEVQRNEPAKEINGSLVVGGGIETSNEAAAYAGNKKFAGKKYQTNIANIAKDDAKLNKKKIKTLEALADHDDYTSFGLLEMNSYKATLDGIDKQQQINSNASNKLLEYQNATNDVAENLSQIVGKKVDPNYLHKGKLKYEKDNNMAKSGKKIKKAQVGDKYDPIAKALGINNDLQMIDDTPQFSYRRPTDLSDPGMSLPEDWMPISTDDQVDGMGYFTSPGKLSANKYDRNLNWNNFKKKVSGKIDEATSSDSLSNIYNEVLPYLRPSAAKPLDPAQLAPEMMALSLNQLEAVPVQSYTARMKQVGRVSLDDQRNEVKSVYAAAKRQAGNNPAAQAAIAAQEVDALGKVNAEEFRINQAQETGVANENIAAINDQNLKNLALFADQAVKQSKARSNTKEQAIEVAKSIADKIAQNKLENLTQKVYENLSKFRFDDEGRLVNYNPLAKFNTPIVGANQQPTTKAGEDLLPIYSSKGDITGYRVKQEAAKAKTGKNGSIVRAIKNL